MCSSLVILVYLKVSNILMCEIKFINMNKIIFFSYSEGMGVTFHLTEFAIELSRHNSELFVIHNDIEQNPGLFSKLKLHNINLLHIKELDKIKPLIDSKTIIHCHGFRQCLLVEKIVKEKKAQLILTLHAYRNSKKYKNIFIKYVMLRFKFIDKWIFSTYNSYLDFKNNNFNSDFSIIPLGIEDISNIEPQSNYIDIYENNVELYVNNHKYIIYGAQFYSHKQHKYLIKSITDFIKKNNNVYLMLCGNGPLMDEMKDLATNLGIKSQVKFLGRIDRNIYLSHLINATLSVVPSVTETFGHSILEPFSLNIPVISTPVGIAPEIIKDFKNGAIFELNNTEKLIKSIEFFCTTNRNIDNEVYLKDFSWEKVVERYVNSYNT